jgi:Phosphoribosylanthranilate isomerase
MTQIKFCGLRREKDIGYVNRLRPDYAGFVLASGFKRTVCREQLLNLTSMLAHGIEAVGVFVDEPADNVADLLNEEVISVAQLHGSEDEKYIARLGKMTSGKIVKCFKIEKAEDIAAVSSCGADTVMLDAGTGNGRTFDWSLVSDLGRDFILAGGLDASNVGQAIRELHPLAVDTSSGIETDGFKDYEKMDAFMKAVEAADAER